jgi:CubicO group peptidase (beta-lactamase class C family)
LITDTDLTQLAREAIAELGIAGAQVSVLHRGGISEGVAGVAHAETGLPVTPRTLFQIGSTTKVFTALLVMTLAEEGRIGLDTPVVEQLPGFRLADPDATASVTPRHLVSMSSGIDNGPYTDHGPGDDALAAYVAALADLPQVFPPGTSFGYSNASTCVSGRLIEHVTGWTWDEALRRLVLEPARLSDTVSVPEAIMIRPFAVGHKYDQTGVMPLRDRWSFGRSTGPSGGTLCSTASDLVRLAHVFICGGETLEGGRLLPPRVAAAMQKREVQVPPTLVAEWWGLGPYGKVWDGVDVMGHSGTVIGGSSYLLWAAERDVAVATTVNTPELGYPFAARMFRELFPRVAGIRVPDPPRPSADVDCDTDRLVGTYRMCSLTLTVSNGSAGLAIEGANRQPGADPVIARSRLVSLTPTTFLPTDPAIDGRRGWALAFLGPEDGPATHLVNGFFNLRRTSA